MTMDRSVSWTDAKSVALLLARATAPRQGALSGVAASGGRRAEAARVVSAPRPAAPATEPAISPPKAQAPAVVPRLEQLSDNPSDRLDALLAWTLDHHRCTGAFVA